MLLRFLRNGVIPAPKETEKINVYLLPKGLGNLGENMYKRQMKAQKILSYLLLAVAVFLFVATLGMSTDLYEGLKQCYDPDIDIEFVKGAKLYVEIQDFNKLAVKLAIVLIVVSLFMFISCSHIRRKYYIFNYIATAVIFVVFVAIAIYIIVGVSGYKAKFLALDFEKFKAFAESESGKRKGVVYTESTFWLDLNIFACVLAIVSAFLAVGNAVWKLILERNEKELLNNNTQEAEVTNG